MDELRITKTAMNMRKNIIDVSLSCNNSAHIGGCLSIVEILATLFGNILSYDINNPLWAQRDRFILSKGHGALGLFSVLYEVGLINKKQFFSFQQNESDFIAHPIMNLECGIESSNGSLGHGLSMGVGICLAAKMNKSNFRTFVLMGDGECNEGSVWEASMTASHYKLNNLLAIVDRNSMQNDGESKDVLQYNNFEKTWESHGWDVKSIDGHNIVELYESLKLDKKLETPRVVIANTIKGKGISFMENVASWHHGRLTEATHKIAIAELNMDKRDA